MRHKLLLSSLLLIGCDDPAGLGETRKEDMLPGEVQPAVASATPPLVSSTGGELLTLKGGNFIKGLSVRLGNVLAQDVILRSNQEIVVRVPTQLGVRGPVDVVVTNPQGAQGVGPRMVTYYPGAVNFGARPDQTAGVGPVGIAMADLRGKGVQDLVAVYAGRGVKNMTPSISVLQGDGKGGYSFAGDFPAGPSAPAAMALGDVSGDGKPDVAVVSTGTDSIFVSLGRANGAAYAFDKPVEVPVGTAPINLVMCDVNNDKQKDIVVVNYGSSNLSVLIAQGDGKFSASAVRVEKAFAVTAGYLNGDGNIDLAYTNVLRNEVNLLFGDGKGGFTPGGSPLMTGTQPHSLAIGDLNADQINDVVVANRGSNTLSVYLNKGDGLMTYLGAPFLGNGPVAVMLRDLNGDGRADVIAPSYENKNVGILVGQDGGYFLPAVSQQISDYASAVAIGDANSGDDNLPDIIAANGNATVGVLLNQSQ